MYFLKTGVIGGGISGLLTSIRLSESGCNVYLYEEHTEVGLPEHCTGIVSKKTLKMMNAPIDECIKKEFTEIAFFNSKGESIKLKLNEPIFSIDRVCLEKKLLKIAEGLGVNVYLKTKVALVDHDRFYNFSTKKIEDFNNIVLAWGNSIQQNPPPFLHKRTSQIIGINRLIEIEGNIKEENYISVYFNHYLSPGFFSWKVPLNRGTFILGLGSLDPKKIPLSLNKFENELFGNNRIKIVKSYGGVINVSLPEAVAFPKKVIAIGDALGMSKPLSGGGIYGISKALNFDVTRINCEDVFEKIKSNIFNVLRELKKQERISRVFHNPSNQELLDETISFISKNYSIISSKAIDYDEHQNFILFPIFSPKLFLTMSLKLIRDKEYRKKLKKAIYSDLLD